MTELSLTCYICNHCQNTFSEPADICSKCGTREPLSRMNLPTRGRIVTFTTVWRGAQYLPRPYVLAVVEFANKYQVLGRVSGGGSIAVKQEVRYMGKDEYGYLFELAG